MIENIKKKDLSIESLRGFAILCVVLIHSTTNEKVNYINYFIDVFSKFAVPMFIFISGYFVYMQKEFIKENFNKYLLKSFKKIGIPYIIISILITIFTFNYYFDFIRNIIFGTASVPYYFIIVIAQLYLLSKFILIFYEKNKNLLFQISFYFILFYSILFYVQLYIKGHIVIPYFMWQFLNYLIYFVLGIDMAAKGYSYQLINNISTYKAFIFFLLALFIALLEVKIHFIRNEQEGDYIALASIIYQTVAILFFWKLKEKIENQMFIYLGIFSFGIFLLHKPILDVLIKIFYVNINIFYGLFSIIISIFIIKLINIIRKKINARITNNNFI